MLNIEKHFSKLSEYCGFKTPGEWGHNPMQEMRKNIEHDTGGAKPLAELL